MLTALIQSSGQKVAAWEAERADKPFVCFCCGREVTLRRGETKAPHFAHRPPVTCEYGAGESAEHRKCKLEIYEHLSRHPEVTKCELERDLRTVRPDVSAYVRGVPVAIEVQLSSLSLGRIAYRTSEYARKGIYVLWLPLYSESLGRELYRPRPWERWLHALYQGRVYYWLGGVQILPVHFRDYLVKVRGRTSDYHKLSAGRVPLSGKELSLADDLQPVVCAARRDGAAHLPESKLYMDGGPGWPRDDHLIKRLSLRRY